MKTIHFLAAFLFFTVVNAQTILAQPTTDTLTHKTLAAGKQYKSNGMGTFFWGKNYRKEWAQPITIQVLNMDTAKGGLMPDKAGGGNQTKSLHLKTSDDRTFTFRSVDKSLGKVLPKIFLNTFIEDKTNDLVSMSHPYGALAVPYMAEKANIPHSTPQYVYVKEQPALDSFNKKFGNTFYLFEERASGNWSSGANMGNFDKYIGTDKVIEKLLEDNDYTTDQRAFTRARLFDMLIGDWDRHEDQWKWGKVDGGKTQIYVPVPSDRDQAFSKHGGLLLNLAMAASGIKYMPSFSSNLEDVPNFNFEQRGVDRLFTNKLNLNDWQVIATAMQQALTNEVIETSVKQLPSQIFSISGNDLIRKLQSRRDRLLDYATSYYRFLAKEVEVLGSKDTEHFTVKRLNEQETLLQLFKITNDGKIKDKPYYERTFNTNETHEIRLFGLSGKDVFSIEGTGNSTLVRIIGGDKKDSIINSAKAAPRYLHVYDDAGTYISKGAGLKLHATSDTSKYSYQYRNFKYDKKGFTPILFFNYMDRLFVGLGYQFIHHKWKKEPFAWKQKIDVHYSISQKTFSVLYDGLFPHKLGKSDLVLKAFYDQVLWTNFFGLGNETVAPVKDINFYRTRSEEIFASIGIHRGWAKNHFTLSPFFQSSKVLTDADRFATKIFSASNPTLFSAINFGGVVANHSVHQLNDSLLPTKGYIFATSASYTQNLKQTNRSVGKFSGDIKFFVPIAKKLSLAVRTGAATVTGTPEFYQNVFIGGIENLRGFRRDRFWGKSAFYNTNELRFISKVKSYLFNGRAGVFAFYDDGRVWMPKENSNTWHTSYGGGVILSPFNMLAAIVTYGVSPEGNLIQIRLNKYF